MRNVANYSEPVLPLGTDDLDEWQILAKLSAIVSGLGTETEVSVIDDLAIAGVVQSAVQDSSSNVYGRDVQQLIDEL